MREIKFRAWNPSVKKMTFFEPPVLTGDHEMTPGMFFKADDCMYMTAYSDPMQFTGLVDKNGVEIYEGDIITGAGGYMHSVFYNDRDSAFRAKMIDKNICDDNCSLYQEWTSCKIVVGNIHQNPEMLEG